MRVYGYSVEFVKSMSIVKFEFAGMPLGILTHTATHEDVKFMTQAYQQTRTSQYS